MKVFIDPYPFNPSALVPSDVKFSPDGRLFAVVTQCGLVSTNEIESTVWVFNVGAERQFLVQTVGSESPKPSAIARMAAVSNDSSITDLKWISEDRLAFLGRDHNELRSLFTVDVNTGKLRKLTPDSQDVNQFDIVNGTTVYTATLEAGKPSKADEIVITGHSISSVLGGESPDIATTFGKASGLWVIRDNRQTAVIDETTGKQVRLITDLLALSPSGHALVVTKHVDHTPKSWEAYEPPSGLSDSYRLKASTPAPGGDPAYQVLEPKQYAVVNLDSGRVDPIDAPLGEDLQYYTPKKALWAKDSRQVLLVNTYLPFEDVEENGKRRLAKNPCVALVNRISGGTTCLALVTQSGFEQYWRDGTIHLLKEVTWDQNTQEVLLRSWTYSNGNDSTHTEDPPEVYRLENGVWARMKNKWTSPRLPLSIEVHQDLNDAPAIFAADPTQLRARKIWDPNPQLQTMRLGEVSVYEWHDQTGRKWMGGLTKPPGFLPGKQYPLVIQTHGFRQREFMTVGTFTTAFAARPLAAMGIMVLQVEEKTDVDETPEEAPVNAGGYVAAIDALAADGLVDPNRVGIIGFSRTGYYTLEALTKTPKRFAAAIIADSDFLGYMQRLLGVDGNPGNTSTREAIQIYGALPFGDGLKAWIEKAPAFNLDKIVTPLRIEVHDLFSVLMNWEIYAGLRLQGKPVDLIQLPSAVHIVAKPLERLASEQGSVEWFDFWLNNHEEIDPIKAEQYSRWHTFRELQGKAGVPSSVSVR